MKKINVSGVTVVCRKDASNKWEARTERSVNGLILKRCGKTAEDAALAIEQSIGFWRAVSRYELHP